MKAVGMRELKNRLSEYVRQVRSGESVLATIGAPNNAAVYPRLPPALAPDRLARLLDDERGPR